MGTVKQYDLFKSGINEVIDLQVIDFKVIKNAPGVTRTHGTWIRNPLLYPPELRGHGFDYTGFL